MSQSKSHKTIKDTENQSVESAFLLEAFLDTFKREMEKNLLERERLKKVTKGKILTLVNAK